MPAAPFDLVITSTRVVTPDGVVPGAVAIRGEVIAAVIAGASIPTALGRLDAGDAVVSPGVVDTHVHVNEPGRTEWEGFETATRAAAAGGVTTIVDMPLNSVPVTTTLAALAAKAGAAAGRASVDYAFWGGVVPGNADQLASLATAGVPGFKCFLVPSGIAEFPHVTADDLRPAMRRLADLALPLLVHAELPGPIERAAAAQADGDPRRHDRWLASRPPAAEHEAIDLVLALAHETGCRVHVVHLSSADGLARIGPARRSGVPVTVETCPHYLTFAAEEIPDGATAFKCAPPIREAENRERLWAGLGRREIDLVASDHSPAPAALKQLDTGSFTEAWGGVASLELSLAATWTGARKRGHGLTDLARWLAEGPAQLAGLAQRKGRIAPGHDADLVVWDPEATIIVDPARLHQRHPLTPYAGRRLHGVVRQTFVRGHCVYDQGTFPAGPIGSWMKRGAS
jgi:allantoinase